MLLTRIFLVIVSVLLSAAVLPSKDEFVIVNGNKITVQANTSFGSINCDYTTTSSTQKDTLLLNRQLLKKDRLKLSIPVEKFNCGNIFLNKDFANTLKAKQYPYARIEVLHLHKRGTAYRGNLKLELADKTMLLENVQFNAYNLNGTDYLKGSICLNFSEVGLSTPKKMGGLLKVEDELQIGVELQLGKSQPGPSMLTGNLKPL